MMCNIRTLLRYLYYMFIETALRIVFVTVKSSRKLTRTVINRCIVEILYFFGNMLLSYKHTCYKHISEGWKAMRKKIYLN